MEDALYSRIQSQPKETDDRRNDESEGESGSDADDAAAAEQTGFPNTGGRQTGPKGVLADHAFYQQQKAQTEAEKRAQYNAKILAKAPTTTTYQQDQEELLILEHKPKEQDELDDDDLLDEKVLEQYRQQRLEQLGRLKNHGARREHKVFGSVLDVGPDDYASQIDREWQSVPVVVHLYDENIRLCNKLDEYLVHLARKYSLAKFMRVSAVQIDFDLVGSPAVLIYKGGLLVANLVRVVDHVGPRFTEEAVESVLLGTRALSTNDMFDRPEDEDQDDDE